MTFRHAFKTGFVVAATVLAAAANAAPAYFFGNAPSAAGVFPTGDPTDPLDPRTAKSTFLNSISNVHVESFEGSAAGELTFNGPLSAFGRPAAIQNTPLPVPNPLEYVGGDVVDLTLNGGNQSGRFNTTGGTGRGKWFESDWGFTLDLDSAVSAFGFYGTDFGDFDGLLEIDLYDSNGIVARDVFKDSSGGAPDTGGTNGSLLFFGYLADTGVSFNRIVFKISQAACLAGADCTLDTLGFDDLIIGDRATDGTPIPEPTSLALVGLALGAAGWTRRARRAA